MNLPNHQDSSLRALSDAIADLVRDAFREARDEAAALYREEAKRAQTIVNAEKEASREKAGS